MRKFLLTVTAAAGLAGAGLMSQAHAMPAEVAAPGMQTAGVQTVQYYGDWREREWRRREEWRRHEEWRRWHYYHGY